MSLIGSIYATSTSILDVTDKVIKAMGMTRTKLEDMLSHGDTGSLTKQVAGSISQFPVAITEDHPIPFASLICEMLELQYANYLTLALSNSPRVDINKINDRKYLNKYHTNLKTMESTMEAVESLLTESFDDSVTESSIAIRLIDCVTEGIEVRPSVMRRLTSLNVEALKEDGHKFEGLEWLFENRRRDESEHKAERKTAASPEDKKTYRDEARKYRDERRTEHETAQKNQDNDITKDPATTTERRAREKHGRDNEAHRAKMDKMHQDMIDAGLADDGPKSQQERDRQADRTRSTVKDAAALGKGVSSEIRSWKQYGDDKKERKEKEATRVKERQEDKAEKEEDRIQSHVTKDFNKIYSYKKLNEMQPTPVTARIFSVDNNGTPSRSIEVVCGVKANLHPISKKEIMSMVGSGEKGDLLTQILRFSSGEIRFFRDVLLSTDSIKGYAEKTSKFHSSGAKILASLKRIKELNRAGDNIKPNASLVISKAVVEETKRVVGINLLDPDEATDFCNKLGIITFIVTDPLGNKLHVLQPDITTEFHVMSTDTLEKQVDAAQDASLTKELRKIISKGD